SSAPCTTRSTRTTPRRRRIPPSPTATGRSASARRSRGAPRRRAGSTSVPEGRDRSRAAPACIAPDVLITMGKQSAKRREPSTRRENDRDDVLCWHHDARGAGHGLRLADERQL